MRTFITILAAISAMVASSSAAFTGYLKLGDIKGESKDKNHAGWSELVSWGTDFRSPATGGNLKLGNFVVVKEMDAASPKLAEHVCSGSPLNQARLQFVDSSDTRKVVYEVRLFDVTLIGSSNGAEANAGTNVRDPGSRWELNKVEPASDGSTRIHWIARSGRDYRILVSPTPGGGWIPVETVSPSPGPTFVDVERLEGTLLEFYKVEAIPR